MTTGVENFKCPATGKLFSISNWKSKIVNGELAYFERQPGWIPLINKENGMKLVKIEPEEIHMTSVQTDTACSK